MKNKTQLLRYLLSLLLLVAVLPSIYAQQKDFGMWQGVGLDYEIQDNLVVSLDEQIRLENNALQIKSVFNNLGVTYEARHEVKYTVGYRFVISPDKTKHRLYSDASYRRKFHKINTSFSLRLRALMESSPQDRGEPKDFYFRTKITAKRLQDFHGFTPYASLELFFHLNNGEREADKYRFAFGTEYKISKRNDVKLAYVFQKTQHVPGQLRSHILYLTLSADISP